MDGILNDNTEKTDDCVSNFIKTYPTVVIGIFIVLVIVIIYLIIRSTSAKSFLGGAPKQPSGEESCGDEPDTEKEVDDLVNDIMKKQK